jgi:hypothetical protein
MYIYHGGRESERAREKRARNLEKRKRMRKTLVKYKMVYISMGSGGFCQQKSSTTFCIFCEIFLM